MDHGPARSCLVFGIGLLVFSIIIAVYYLLSSFICSPRSWKNVDEAELAKRVNGSRAAGQRRDTRLFNYPGASNTSCSG